GGGSYRVIPATGSGAALGAVVLDWEADGDGAAVSPDRCTMVVISRPATPIVPNPPSSQATGRSRRLRRGGPGGGPAAPRRGGRESARAPPPGPPGPPAARPPPPRP